MSAGWEAVRFDELDAIPIAEGLVWHPLRRRLGIRAFGINAYTSEAVGSHVVEQHNEAGDGGGGHEELYVVIRGRATFTIAGETLAAPAGTLVFIREPSLERVAIAEEEGTLVLAVGGEPGRAYEPSAWEWYFAASPALKAERWQDAIAMLEEGLRERPGDPGSSTTSPAPNPAPGGLSRRWRISGRPFRRGRATPRTPAATPTSTRSGPSPASRDSGGGASCLAPPTRFSASR